MHPVIVSLFIPVTTMLSHAYFFMVIICTAVIEKKKLDSTREDIAKMQSVLCCVVVLSDTHLDFYKLSSRCTNQPNRTKATRCQFF